MQRSAPRLRKFARPPTLEKAIDPPLTRLEAKHGNAIDMALTPVGIGPENAAVLWIRAAAVALDRDAMGRFPHRLSAGGGG